MKKTFRNCIIFLLAVIPFFVNASGLPTVTLNGVYDSGSDTPATKTNGVYQMEGGYYRLNFSFSGSNDEYCFLVYKKDYKTYDYIGKVANYVNDVEYICGYNSDNSYDVYVHQNEADTELTYGFVKESEADALETEYPYEYYQMRHTLAMQDATKIYAHVANTEIIDGSIENVGVTDSNNNELDGYYEFSLTPSNTYNFKFNVGTQTPNNYKIVISDNDNNEMDPKLGTVTINSDNTTSIPVTIPNDAPEDGVIAITFYEDDEFISTHFFSFVLTTKKRIDVDLKYKNFDASTKNFYYYSLESRYYNENNPLIVSVNLVNFTGSHSGTVEIVKSTFDYETLTRTTEVMSQKNVTFNSGSINNVEINDFVPTLLTEGSDYYAVRVTVGQYEYFESFVYTEGIIKSVVYDSTGKIIVLGLEGQFVSGDGYAQYKKSKLLNDNIYASFSVTSARTDKNYKYKISYIVDDYYYAVSSTDKHLIKEETISGEDLLDKNIFVSVKKPANLEERLVILFELFNDKDERIAIYADNINYAKSTKLTANVDLDSNIDVGTHTHENHYYRIYNSDTINLNLLGESFDNDKTYGYIVEKDEYEVLSVGTITGTELNNGKTLSIDMNEKDGYNVSVYIFELDSGTIQLKDENKFAGVNFEYVTKDEFDNDLKETHFVTDTATVQELIDSSKDYDAFFIGESNTPIVPPTPDEPTALVVPTISFTANNNQVTVNWDDQEAATKYEVNYSTDKKKWTKKEVTTNSYVVKSLTFNKTYYFKVRAYDGTKWTGYSNTVSKKIVPNKVTNLVIKSAGTNNIKIGYDKVSTTGYEIYRSTDNKNWTKVKTITDNKTLEFNNKDLKANKTYYYKVRAYKTVSGNKIYGSYSAVVSTKTAPAKPSFSVKLKDYNAMNLVIGEAKGATKYIVQKSLDGKTWTALEELTKYGTLAVSDLELGKTYYFAVKVCNSQNRCSGWVKANLKQTTKTPGFSLKTSSKKVTVTMSKVNGATGYQIYRATSKNGKYSKVKEFSSEVELLQFVNKTTKGKTYYYKVRSFALDENNARVYSPYSSVKSIKSK